MPPQRYKTVTAIKKITSMKLAHQKAVGSGSLNPLTEMCKISTATTRPKNVSKATEAKVIPYSEAVKIQNPAPHKSARACLRYAIRLALGVVLIN